MGSVHGAPLWRTTPARAGNSNAGALGMPPDTPTALASGALLSAAYYAVFRGLEEIGRRTGSVPLRGITGGLLGWVRPDLPPAPTGGPVRISPPGEEELLRILRAKPDRWPPLSSAAGGGRGMPGYSSSQRRSRTQAHLPSVPGA